MSGIYAITTEGYFYIGLSSNLLKRKREHFRNLENGVHPNLKMQGVYEAGNEFIFTVLERCEVEELESKELEWFDKFIISNPEMEPMNLKKCGSMPTFSYEAREWISKGKAINQYDWNQRYVVTDSYDDEILYIGDILDISKSLNIPLSNIFNIEKSWNDVLGHYIRIREALDDSILEWLND